MFTPIPSLRSNDARSHASARSTGRARDAQASALVLRDTNVDLCRLEGACLAAGGGRSPVGQARARVASWAAKGELTCLLPLAAARAGLVHVPINPLLKRAQVAHILADSGAVLLLGTKARLATLEDGDVPSGCRVLEESEFLPRRKSGTATLGSSQHDPDALAAILLHQRIDRQAQRRHAQPRQYVAWRGLGRPLSRHGRRCHARGAPAQFRLWPEPAAISTWYAGGSVVPLDYLFPRDVAKACGKHRVTTLAGVPPLWVQMTESRMARGCGRDHASHHQFGWGTDFAACGRSSMHVPAKQASSRCMA